MYGHINKSTSLIENALITIAGTCNVNNDGISLLFDFEARLGLCARDGSAKAANLMQFWRKLFQEASISFPVSRGKFFKHVYIDTRSGKARFNGN